MATFPSKVNYATGDILTATNMNDVGGAINLLDGAQGSAGKNEVLNSNFSVWQRGTSMAGSTTAFSADRWQAYRGVAGSTFSRQLTNDTTNLPNIQYALRVQRDSGNTATNDIIAVQNFESVNSIPFAGKTVTFSFYARAGANYSGSSNQLGGFIYSGTGTDQNTIAGFTGQTTVINSASFTTLTTTWQRFTVTSTSVVPTNCTQLAVAFRYTPVGTAGANDYFEVTGVQLEAANTASPYAPNTSTYQGELAACQRYYWRWPISTTNAQTGIAQSTTITDFYIRTPVTMRTNGTAVDFTALQVYNIILAANYSSGSFTLLQSTVDHLVLRYTHGSGVFTLGAAGYVLNGSGSTAYVGITGEL